MRFVGCCLVLLGGVLLSQALAAQSTIPPLQLVREVVYNEQNDHDRHGYWRYWVEHHSQQRNDREEQVETADGPVKVLRMSNGHPLDVGAETKERARLNQLMRSPEEQSKARLSYQDDEKRIGRILSLLSDAFVYEDLGEENGCRHLRFHPNPNYPAKTMEARVFHAMSGDLWLSTRYKRLARLDGHLEDNLDFGFGLLGRLYKGGWFRLERAQVSQTDWKTERLEVHMNGRALLLKTIDRETSEARGGFKPIPPRLSLVEGLAMLSTPQNNEAALPPAKGQIALLRP